MSNLDNIAPTELAAALVKSAVADLLDDALGIREELDNIVGAELADDEFDALQEIVTGLLTRAEVVLVWDTPDGA